MKCTSLHILLLLMLVTTMLACETVVDVSVPENAPKISAQGFFTADSAWAVRVVKSVDFTSADHPILIDDAFVEIKENGLPFITLPRADSGSYASVGGKKPAIDNEYTLHVAVPGFEPVTGSDVLPQKPDVPALMATFDTTSQTTATRRQVMHIQLDINDPAEIENYYGLFLLQARLREDIVTKQFQPFPPSLFLFESDDLALGESDLGFLDPENQQYLEAFFSDGLFDGKRYPLKFSFQYELSPPNADQVMHRAFAVVLLSVSAHFFHYWETASDQSFSNGNPFAEPLRVHSNMSGGLGIFAGFQYTVYPVAVDTLGVNNVCPLAAPYQSLCQSLLGAALPITGR